MSKEMDAPSPPVATGGLRPSVAPRDFACVRDSLTPPRLVLSPFPSSATIAPMIDRTPSGTAETPPTVLVNSTLWLLLLPALLAGQAWATFGLFGHSWDDLRDDRPILSGRHPLHLYHGHLGARTLLERGSVSCFDPAFQAGYPKTPVFDPGSRPAEMVLALVGGDFRPSAYKIALAVFCTIVPMVVFFAARMLGLQRGPAVVATLLAQCVWWGRPGREALEVGDIDLLLAGLALLAQLGFLVRYHRRPGVFALLGVVLSGLIAWLAHPLLSGLLLPLVMLFYFSVSARHRLAWHLPLFAGLLVALGANAFWLFDWVSYWWILVPAGPDGTLPPARAIWAFWELPVWGEGSERVFTALLVVSALIGVGVLHRRRRQGAVLLGPAVLGLLALAVFGACREPFARMGAANLLTPALLYATVPAGAAIVWGMGLLRRVGGVAAPILVALVSLGAAYFTAPNSDRPWIPSPLTIGLGDERTSLVADLEAKSDETARILWEDRQEPRRLPRWAALLPHLTGRAFVGGLDPEEAIEHATTGLREDRLAGRPLGEWTDTDLAAYCRRYNVGWIVCRSEASLLRFRLWKAAKPAEELPSVEGVSRWLIPIERERSFALKGAVTWKSADSQGILLADLVPQAVPGESAGQVVLSLHYQSGMRVRPSRIRLEKAVDPQDTIPFVRLRTDEPVGRVFITWDGR